MTQKNIQSSHLLFEKVKSQPLGFVKSLICALLVSSCLVAPVHAQDPDAFAQVRAQDPDAFKYSQYMSMDGARKHLSTLASDEFEGRETGKPGAKKAADYIAKEFKKLGLAAPVDGSYFQQVILKDPSLKAVNVLGYLEGTDLKEEVLVFSAHYDHIGINASGKDRINNGADDDGSGTTAILELARAFSYAKKEGKGPRRSLLFLAVVGEEKGLLGSAWYTSHPVFPLKNTIADLNIDMIGRIDPAHQNNPNYCYLIGSDKLSSTLHQISEQANATYTKLDIDYKYNAPDDPERIYYRSDHYNFAKNNIPIIFYFNGVHEDYHKPSDEISKIRFDLLIKRAQLVFYTGWELANRNQRPLVDKQ